MSPTDADDKTCTDGRTSPAPTRSTAHPSVPQVYPRTHLLGVPQELQDLIFDEVFNKVGSDLIGAKWLAPLLTCRHVYHIANQKAWAGATFSLSYMSEQKLSQLKSKIPPSVGLRHTNILSVNRGQLMDVHGSHTLLPHFEIVNVTSPASAASNEEDEAREWYSALIVGASLHITASKITFPHEAFTVMMVVEIEVESALKSLSDAIAGEKSTMARVKHQMKGFWPEHYSITYMKGGQASGTLRIFRYDA